MSRRRLLALLIGGATLVLLAFVGVIFATSGSSSDELVIYSARSHYGEEEPFKRFAKETGTICGCAAARLPSCTSGCRPRATTRPRTS